MYEPPYDDPYAPLWFPDEGRRPGYRPSRSPYMDGYGGPEQRSTLPGSLLLLAGLLGVMNGVVLLIQRDQLARMLEDWGFDASSEMITYTAVVYIILAMFPLLGGFLHLMGGKPGIVKLMAVFGVISFGPMLLSSILSLIALILLTRGGQPEIRGPPRDRRDQYGHPPVPPPYYGPPSYPEHPGPYPGDPYYPPYPWGPDPYDRPGAPMKPPARGTRERGRPAGGRPGRIERPASRKKRVRKVVKVPVTGTEGRPKDPPADGPGPKEK